MEISFAFVALASIIIFFYRKTIRASNVASLKYAVKAINGIELTDDDKAQYEKDVEWTNKL